MNSQTQLRRAHISDNFVITLATQLWNIQFAPGTMTYRNLDSYVLALERKLELFQPARHILRNFQHLFDLVGELRNLRNNPNRPTRQDLFVHIWRVALVQNIPGVQPRTVYNSIDFAVHVWLMLRFNDEGEGGELLFKWRPNQTLDEALEANFPATLPESFRISLHRPAPPNQPVYEGTVIRQDDPLTPENDRVFSSLFTLRDIHTLGDFVIQPTDNILQHLYVEKFRKRKFRVTVFIFFHASVLAHLQNATSGALNHHSPLIDETLATLSLLLPDGEEDCTKWFRRYSNKYHKSSLDGIDPQAGSQPPASRKVADYNFWRPRLLVLEKEFEASSPRTIRQWWYDRRRWRDWATFWVAFVALLLALASVLSGIVSAVLGGYSWEEAKVANAFASIASTSAASLAEADRNSSSTPSCCYPAMCYSGTTMAGNYSTQTSLDSATSTIVTSTSSLQDPIFTDIVIVTDFITTITKTVDIS